MPSYLYADRWFVFFTRFGTDKTSVLYAREYEVHLVQAHLTDDEDHAPETASALSAVAESQAREMSLQMLDRCESMVRDRFLAMEVLHRAVFFRCSQSRCAGVDKFQ